MAVDRVQTPDFDALYRHGADPFAVRSSFYEQRKLALLLACLTRATYAKAWDPSCGVGELAARLADRAEQVVATDASIEAVDITRARCADRPQVAVRPLRLPESPGADGFDLVVLSEFLYYLPAPDRAATLTLVDGVAAREAELIAVHWRPKPHDAWLSGADVQADIVVGLRDRGWHRRVHHDDTDFVLDVLRRGAGG